MNKAELIRALSEHYNGSKADAAKALNAVVQTITHQTAAGEKVSITGFGVFEKVSRGERMVRNPRTGERKLAEATTIPRFRPGTDLKAYVSGAKQVPDGKAPVPVPAANGSPAPTDPAPGRRTASKKAHRGTATQVEKTVVKVAAPAAKASRTTVRSAAKNGRKAAVQT